MGVEVFCAGSHPFSPPQLQPVTDKARYAKLIDRTQWWGRQMVIYGVHVHVGLDRREKVLPVLDGLVNYFPHFQALSASSPFWGGEDTGYASHRALMFQQLPTAGLPFQFPSWDGIRVLRPGHVHHRRDRHPVRDPLGHPAGPQPGHHRDAHLRRPGHAGGSGRHRSPDPVPGGRVLHHPGQRRDHSHHAALARPGKQMACRPLRHGSHHHPRRRGQGAAGHGPPAGDLEPAGARGGEARLPGRARRRRKDHQPRGRLPAPAPRGRGDTAATCRPWCWTWSSRCATAPPPDAPRRGTSTRTRRPPS